MPKIIATIMRISIKLGTAEIPNTNKIIWLCPQRTAAPGKWINYQKRKDDATWEIYESRKNIGVRSSSLLTSINQ
jgi:hypothetical protein